ERWGSRNVTSGTGWVCFARAGIDAEATPYPTRDSRSAQMVGGLALLVGPTRVARERSGSRKGYGAPQRRSPPVGSIYSMPNTERCAWTNSDCACTPHHNVSASAISTPTTAGAVHDTGTGSPWGSCMYIATVTRR